MFKRKVDSVMKETESNSQGAMHAAKGMMQRASQFIARHVQRGERLLEIEKMEKEYDLEEYMWQYHEAFESEMDYEEAKNRVLNRLIDEYLAEVPDSSKYTYKAEYMETQIDKLFEEEITRFEKKKRLNDIFEVKKSDRY